jgi:hypothetical protein
MLPLLAFEVLPESAGRNRPVRAGSLSDSKFCLALGPAGVRRPRICPRLLNAAVDLVDLHGHGRGVTARHLRGLLNSFGHEPGYPWVAVGPVRTPSLWSATAHHSAGSSGDSGRAESGPEEAPARTIGGVDGQGEAPLPGADPPPHGGPRSTGRQRSGWLGSRHSKVEAAGAVVG